MAFTYYDSNLHSLTDLLAALLAPVPGLVVDPNSIRLQYGDIVSSHTAVQGTSLSFYDGSLGLGIGAGLLLTSGDGAPPTINTSDSYSVSFNYDAPDFSFDDLLTLDDFATEEEYQEYLEQLYADAGGTASEPDLEATINAAFVGAGSIYDLTSLEFSFTITDPAIKGVTFDVVFGSDEYPEFTDSDFVDVAGVYVNGTNYALFNESIFQPLSVLGTNLAAGNFRSNEAGQFPLEYDGLTSPLQIVAPVNPGVNTFKIAIADTGDSIYDSGVFVANLIASEYAGFGLAESIVIPVDAQGLTVEDGLGNQIYEFLGGDNSIVINGGNDIVKGGPGFTSVLLPFAVGDVQNYSLVDGVLTVTGPVGTTGMIDVARLKLVDLSVALDTLVGGKTWAASSLLNAAFGSLPDTQTLSQWVAQADESETLPELAQKMIDFYAPAGVSDEELVTLLYQNLAGVAPSSEQLSQFVSTIGSGKEFETQADLFAFAARLDENQNQMVGLIGNLVVLDDSYF